MQPIEQEPLGPEDDERDLGVDVTYYGSPYLYWFGYPRWYGSPHVHASLNWYITPRVRASVSLWPRVYNPRLYGAYHHAGAWARYSTPNRVVHRQKRRHHRR